MSVYEEIAKERVHQDKKYGENRNLSMVDWTELIIAEIREALVGDLEKKNPPHDFRTEIIQVAALCVAAAESYDRQYLKGKKEQKIMDRKSDFVDIVIVSGRADITVSIGGKTQEFSYVRKGPLDIDDNLGELAHPFIPEELMINLNSEFIPGVMEELLKLELDHET